MRKLFQGLALALVVAVFVGDAALINGQGSFGLTASVVSATDARAADFSLKNQYDEVQTYQFPKDKLSVLAFGDRSGSEQIEGWIKPLVARYGERIDIHGVAVLTGVPSPARGIVRRIMKNQVKYPVMLDWKGAVARSYAYEDGRANIYVIDREGNILLRLAGAADQSALENVFDRIDKLLKS